MTAIYGILYSAERRRRYTEAMTLHRNVLWMVVAAGLLIPASISIGQTLQERGYRPVDQLVEDIDPLNRSFREREAGLYEFGQHNNVFQRINPDPHPFREQEQRRLYFINRGVVAEFDQSQYFIVKDDERTAILQLIPPNTVFHIGLPDARPMDPETQQNIEQAPRMGEPVEQRIDGRISGRPKGPEIPQDNVSQRDQRLFRQWQVYLREIEDQQTATLMLLKQQAQAITDEATDSLPDKPNEPRDMDARATSTSTEEIDDTTEQQSVEQAEPVINNADTAASITPNPDTAD